MKFGARVLWDLASANTYRWGAEDAFDLEVVGEVDKDTDIASLRSKAPPATPPPPPLCASDEVNALRALYAGTGGARTWRSRVGWSVFDKPGFVLNDTTDPCRLAWDGVICVDGHIAAL